MLNANKTAAALLSLTLLSVSGCSTYEPHKESYAGLIRGGNVSAGAKGTYKDDAVLHKALGEKYYKDRQYHLAIEEFSRAAEASPGDADVYEGLGRSYREAGDFDKAIGALEKGIALLPPSGASRIRARLYNSKAITYDMMGRHEEAITNYDNAIKLDPTNDTYYNNKGFSALMGGQTDEAIFAFKEAIGINFSNKTAHANLGYAYGLKGLNELALNEFKLASDEASAYNNLGYIYFKNDNMAGAVGAYDNALRINPGMLSAYYNRGRAYELLGDADKAIQSYQEFLKHTTKSSEAEEAFNRIRTLRGETGGEKDASP